MSIREWIGEMVACHCLHPLEPVLKSDPIAREMYLSAEVFALIDGPWGSSQEARRCNKLRADLEAFVTGRRRTICVRPFKARNDQMALLDPVSNGVWDIRSQNPAPGLRIFGMFAAKDVFLALIPAARSKPVDYLSRGPFEGKDDPAWGEVITETKDLWRRTMSTYQPVSGDNADDYFSQGYDCR
jgi:hypothetical protein